MARKKKHEEHENHERWLISYADFITLLFAFFVVMYSLSVVNEGKFRVLAEALNAAFRSKPALSVQPIQLSHPIRSDLLNNTDVQQPTNAAGDPRAIALPRRPFSDPGQPANAKAEAARARAMKEIADKVAQAMAELIAKDLITVRRHRQWIEVEIKTNILFSSGSAQLQPAAEPVLKKLAGILRDYPNRLHVEGFTDNKPIKTAAFPSNWELSTARATSVIRLFSGAGIDPGRLAAVGYGEHRPAAANDTEEGRSQNRKVVLVVMGDDAAPRLRDATASRAPEAVPGRTGYGASAIAPGVALPPPSLESKDATEQREPAATVKPAPRAAPPEAPLAAPVEQSPPARAEIAASTPAAEKPAGVTPAPRTTEAAARSAPTAGEKPMPAERVISLPTFPRPGG